MTVQFAFFCHFSLKCGLEESPAGLGRACLKVRDRIRYVRPTNAQPAPVHTTLAARWCVTTTNSFGELHPGVRCMEAQTGHVCVGDVACAEDRPELAERALSERSHDSSSYDSSQVFGVLEKPACR